MEARPTITRNRPAAASTALLVEAMDRYNAQNSYDARARGRPAVNTGVLIISNEAISTRNYMLKKPPKDLE